MEETLQSDQEVQSTISRIQEISAKFELAESLVSDDVQEVIDCEVKNIINNKTSYDPIDVMSVENMADDFAFSRKLLKDSIYNGKLVLDKATQDLLLSDDKGKAGNTMAFAELTTAVLNGVKTYSQLYKDFSIVLLNIKKINTTEVTDQPVQHITNNLNITDNISTVDLIAKLKSIK